MAFQGLRIGTAYQDSDLSYCADDNTYTEIPTLKRAMACPIEWSPRNLYPDASHPLSFDEFLNLLFAT